MSDITATGVISGSFCMSGGPQAWLRLPKGVSASDAVERGWVVVEVAGTYNSRRLILCEQVTYYGGPKGGMYWEPVQLSSLPEPDLP